MASSMFENMSDSEKSQLAKDVFAYMFKSSGAEDENKSWLEKVAERAAMYNQTDYSQQVGGPGYGGLGGARLPASTGNVNKVPSVMTGISGLVQSLAALSALGKQGAFTPGSGFWSSRFGGGGGGGGSWTPNPSSSLTEAFGRFFGGG